MLLANPEMPTSWQRGPTEPRAFLLFPDNIDPWHTCPGEPLEGGGTLWHPQTTAPESTWQHRDTKSCAAKGPIDEKLCSLPHTKQVRGPWASPPPPPPPPKRPWDKIPWAPTPPLSLQFEGSRERDTGAFRALKPLSQVWQAGPPQGQVPTAQLSASSHWRQGQSAPLPLSYPLRTPYEGL